MKKLIPFLLFVFICFHAPGAKGELKSEEKFKGGYGYNFDDDPLAAGGFGPNDSRIRVREGAARATLIRPRTSFITELLKSVENL